MPWKYTTSPVTGFPVSERPSVPGPSTSVASMAADAGGCSREAQATRPHASRTAASARMNPVTPPIVSILSAIHALIPAWLVRAFEPFGLDGRPPPSHLTVDSPLDDRLACCAAMEEVVGGMLNATAESTALPRVWCQRQTSSRRRPGESA